MGNSVTLQFDAQTASYVQNVLKAKAAHEAMANSAEKMSESMMKMDGQVVKASKTLEVNSEKLNQAAFGARNAGEAVSGVGVAMTLIGSITAGISAAFQEHMSQMKEKVKSFRSEIEATSKILAPQGQLNFAGSEATRAATDRIGSDLFSKRDIRQVYNEISKRGGAENTIDEKRRATAAAIQAGEAGHEDLAGFGATFAELSKSTRKGGGLEGMNDTQLGGITAQFMKFKPGGMTEQDVRFFNRNKDKMQALNLIMAASRSAESARGLEALEVEADQEPDAELQKKARKHPHKLTDEERRRIALSEIAPDDRIGAMMADSSLVPAKSRRLVGSLSGDFDGDEMQRAAREDLLGQQRASAYELEKLDGRFGTVRQARKLDVRIANGKEQGEFQAMLKENASKEFEARAAENTGYGGFLGKAMDAWNRPDAPPADPHLEELRKQTESLEYIKWQTRRRAELGGPLEDK